MSIYDAPRVLKPGFEWVWGTSMHASLLIGLVVLVQFLFRGRLTARHSYVLGLLVLVRLLIPAVPASRLSPFELVKYRDWQAPQESPRHERLSVSLAGFITGSGNGQPSMSARPLSARPDYLVPAAGTLWVLGFTIILGTIIWRHHRFSRMALTFTRITDPGRLGLLRSSMRQMRVSKPVTILATAAGHSPALFGWRRPKVLLPERILAQFTEDELRMVLLHELAHVKRHDILLNWLIILVQAVHWFNPFVWLALRRLRADREMVCDDIVLRALTGQECHLYGETLLKLLDFHSGLEFGPGLAPVIDNKPAIKRRIIMISKFNSVRRSRWILPVTLLMTLCWLGFTKAADEKKTLAVNQTPAPEAGSKVDKSQLPGFGRGLELLNDKLAEQQKKVESAQKKVDALRQQLGARLDSSDQLTADSLDPESMRLLERERISAELQKAHYEALLSELKAKSREELRQTLPTAVPDTLLTSLLDRLSSSETEYATLSTNLGLDTPQLKALSSAISNLNKQIEARINGILAGLDSQAATYGATSASLQKSVRAAKAQDAASTERYRPYFLAKRDLDTEQRILETIKLRVLQEAIDADLRTTQPPQAR